MIIPTPGEIREKRVKLGMTQSETARKSGLSQSMIARIESGSVDPRVSTLRKILSVLQDAEKSALTAVDLMFSPVISVESGESLAKAVSIMGDKGISQLPVIDNGVPIGCISESAIINAMEDGRIKEIGKHLAKDLMEDCFPVVGPSTDPDTIMHLLHSHHAVLVLEKGTVKGVITKHDLIAKRP
ncbi:CBS domain-containing protein [Methanoplanus endosymbiosus]|uniref:CBS domain-containing protein n=1 Tax=Methanoplanus endosymbiosus TaxID=33865 RepID=A0A9E7PKK6_9EURY|nr:CBS domain-containing protein [Methanoplanus endosymbiosus]UUX91850.1 CBS domain-containing protein [Methanoplanus endosymbiosus]